MDFPFDVQKHLPLDHQGFAVLDTTSQQPRNTGVSTATYNRGPTYISQDSTKSCLAQIIDKMGEASSRAQGLGAIITSYGKFISSGDNRLYIKVEGNQVCGILKVGKKNLFYNAGFGGFKEVKPLCVLDFYVHESMQRKGVGKILFEKMLAKEGIEPEKLAYDRPSSKFIAFLKKHYGLTNYTPQNNNFVIFNQYWDTATKPANTRGQSIDSIQDYRDKKFGSNQISQPTIPQKTETSIAGSKYKNDNVQEENKSFQSNQLPPKPVPRVNNNTQNYNSGPSYPVKGSEQNNRSRAAFLERIKGNEVQDTDAQMKAADEAFAKLKVRPDSLDMGKGKTQIWNVPSQQNYTSKAPWGGYGTTMDAFKSSSTYGSYYNQPGSNLRKK